MASARLNWPSWSCSWKKISVIFIFCFMALLPAGTFAQQASITALTVVTKPGTAEGIARATIITTKVTAGGKVTTRKTSSIAHHVLQAWPVMNGEGALLLLAPAKNQHGFRLRYYDTDAAKGRTLGVVPFSAAAIAETRDTVDWAFAIAGTEGSQRDIYVGNRDAIHARIAHATSPHFVDSSLIFYTENGEQKQSISALLGQDVEDAIFAPENTHGTFLQFLPSGKSLLFLPDNEIQHGHWILEGDTFHVFGEHGSETEWPRENLHRVSGIPVSTILSVRLLQPLSSRTAKNGMEIQAVSVTPAVFHDGLLLPQGTEFGGTVVDAHSVGWGIEHETAAITLRFQKATLPDGRTLNIDAWVYKVDNSREDVTSKGKIQGIRSTGTLGYSGEDKLTALAQVDPIAYGFLGASGPAVLGFADPEILYNAGTDLLVQFQRPVITNVKYSPAVPHSNFDAPQAAKLNAMVEALPFRTKTEVGGKDSDITNLIFIGNPGAVERAFQAAHWTTSDALTAAATFQTIKTISGNHSYSQAPMSTLLLNHQHPVLTLQKTTNTFSARHHVRVFPTQQKWDGETVLTASSTQDIGISFSTRQKTFIHIIDQYLDNERSKIINDLEFTGCVKAVDLVERPWVPQDAYNSTGDRLRTDGKVAVLYFNDCEHPHTTPVTPALRADTFQRSERNTILVVKNTLYRGNVLYQGITGTMKAHSYFSQSELPDDMGSWRKSIASEADYTLPSTYSAGKTALYPQQPSSPEADAELAQAAKRNLLFHRWDPPHFEIALNFGYSRYRNNILETTLVELESSNPNKPFYILGLGDDVYDGWAAGFSLTLNTWNYVSNEFSYMREQDKFDLVSLTVSSDPQTEPEVYADTAGLTTRRFAYNTVGNFRPRTSRFRPYIDAGPALQLVSLANAPLKKPDGYFRLGLANVGLLKAAFDFGSTPPLDGGGIFQPALQYGAGVKYRVHPRILLRADFGETWSANPKIIRDSYLGYVPDGLDDTYTTNVMEIKPPSKYFQQHATVGVAFTF